MSQVKLGNHTLSFSLSPFLPLSLAFAQESIAGILGLVGLTYHYLHARYISSGNFGNGNLVKYC